jgi:tRNA (guanine37-N1)-methyltransferase
MRFTLLTLFPEMFPGPLGQSIAGKALEKGLWSYETVQMRDFATDKHGTVDDTPYGGGAGMVMKPDVLGRAIENVLEKQPNTKLIYPSPRGKLLNQNKIATLAQEEHITILCGRYEGVDERVLQKYQVEEVSIGDYILSGGEIAAITILDACIRKINGVLGNHETHLQESFEGEFSHLLEYPLYTKPADWQGLKVPEVLQSGNHKLIAEWRKQQSEAITEVKRPDMWLKYKAEKTPESKG